MATHYATGFQFRCNTIVWNAHDLASKLERPGDSCQVPIILSAVAMESFFYELQIALEMPLTGAGEVSTLQTLATTLEELEESHASLRLKVQLAYFVLTQKHLDRGRGMYPDINILVKLRDALVHPKAATFDTGAPEKGVNFKLVSALIGGGVVKAGADREPLAWTEHVLTPPVARWAVNTAIDRIWCFIELLPAGHPTRTSFESILGGIPKLDDSLN